MKFIAETPQNIELMALLLAFAKASAALSHSDLIVVGLTQPFSMES